MSLFENFASLFRRTHETPPNLPAPHSPTGLNTPDTRETNHAADADEHQVEHQAIDDVGSELWGISFSIEYRDANANVTVRGIRIRRFSRTAQGWLCMGAYCYERKALRSFRLDRVVSIIDEDGVIWETRDFFSKELHVDLGEFHSPGRAGSARSKKGRQARRGASPPGQGRFGRARCVGACGSCFARRRSRRDARLRVTLCAEGRNSRHGRRLPRVGSLSSSPSASLGNLGSKPPPARSAECRGKAEAFTRSNGGHGC
jgi:hypothetical protein